MGIPAIHITLNGKKMKASYQLSSLDIHMEVNRIPWAEICLIDGDAAKRKFTVSESGDFDPGTKVRITMSYVNKPGTQAPVFEGIVTGQAVEMNRSGQLLRIECKHQCFAMTRIRKSMVYTGKADPKVVKLLAGNYTGKFKVDATGLTGPEHKELVQYFASDWDFLMSRCHANGWLIVPKVGNLKVMASPRTTSPVPKGNVMDFNVNELYAMELAIDGSTQYESATAQAWNVKEQATAAPVKEAGTKHNPGKFEPGALQSLSKTLSQQLFNGTPMPPAELKAWAAGSISRSRLAFLRGRFELQGNAKLAPGQTCKIVGVGTRFDGLAFVTAVRHRASLNGWTTDVQVGLPAQPRIEPRDTMDAPAAGLLPAVNGLQIGVVKKFKEDKEGMYRVQVHLPAMGKTTNLLWARLAMPTAGKGEAGSRGMLFWPEPGDEVIVGFLNDDPRAAIVLGSLFNSPNPPIYPHDAKNPKKGLITKSGSKLEFDDVKKEVTLSTKEKLEMKFNEKEQSIIVKERGEGAVLKLDKKGIILVYKGNKLEINKDGVKINGGGSKLEVMKAGVKIDTKKKLSMKAVGAIMDGGPKAEIKGGMVELK